MISGDLDYLMSSLPNLTFQNAEETQKQVVTLLQNYSGSSDDDINLSEILDGEARKFLPTSIFQVFQKFSLNNIHELEFQQSKSKVLSAFSKFMHNLKVEINQLRNTDRSVETKSPQNNLEKIIGQGTPLEKEVQIMKYQWDKLEDLSAGHFANLEALIIYKIKLMILLRWWSFNANKGFTIFTQLTSTK